jgi:hypothetical protein
MAVPIVNLVSIVGDPAGTQDYFGCYSATMRERRHFLEARIKSVTPTEQLGWLGVAIESQRVRAVRESLMHRLAPGNVPEAIVEAYQLAAAVRSGGRRGGSSPWPTRPSHRHSSRRRLRWGMGRRHVGDHATWSPAVAGGVIGVRYIRLPQDEMAFARAAESEEASLWRRGQHPTQRLGELAARIF